MSQAKVVCQACSTEFAVATPTASASTILNDDDFSSFVAHHPRIPCPGCGLIHTTILTGVNSQWGIVVARNQDLAKGEAREKPLIEVVSGSGSGRQIVKRIAEQRDEQTVKRIAEQHEQIMKRIAEQCDDGSGSGSGGSAGQGGTWGEVRGGLGGWKPPFRGGKQ